MTHRGIVLWCSVLLLAAALAACDDDPKNPPGPDQEISPDQEDGDILPDGDVEVSPDAEVEETPDDTDTPDDETDVVEPDRVTCSRTIPASTNGVCSIAAGSSKMVILEGTVLAGNKIYENGRVLFDSSNRNGRISCVGCDCEDASATVVSCAKGVISPSLINTHDHITFCEAAPATHPQERYEHRHDWRKGLRSHTKLPVSGGANVTYGELRMLFGGTTSIAGSGSAPGLLRNLDRSDDLEGLQGIDVDYRTFPLGDSGGTQLSTGCGYPSIDSESRARSAGIYHAHISEGIDDVTRNEFVCTSANNGGGQDLVNENTSIVHAVGLRAIDVQTMADEGAKLIWSPRSNVDLYGNTAQVVLFRNLGVTISLGTDWSASGSINMLRELQCADYLNRNHYNNTFSDYELWMMATYNGAIATGAETQIGLLATGYVADIAVFDGSTHKDYRAVIDAEVSDVNLVFRGGQALLADAPLMATLRGSEASNCENVDVCGVSKSICLKLETGMTLSALKAQVGGAYGLFYCDTPPNEPSCVPWRKNEYEGISSPDDPDGDGIANSEDNCPLIFNPVRNKLDIGGQGDADNDGIGDACDRCPLNEGEECGAPAPDDRDRDGVKDFEDNCPANPNPDQDDRDNDQIGDVCDLCPDDANPNGAACPATVYAVKRGEIPQGTPVSITGLVATAVTTDGKGIFAQADPSDPNVFSGADFSGIYVYLGSGFTGAAPTRGQRFDVEGTIGAYFDQIQLSAITSISIDSTYSAGEPAPVVVEPALVATGGSRADALEAVLVDVGSVTVLSTSPTPGFAGHNVENEFDVSGNLRVDNFLYTVTPMPAESSTITSLKGVVRWGNSLSNLLPRDGSDVITGPATLSEIQPTVAYLAAGTTANTIPEMQLVMTRNVDADAVITLSYDNPTVLSGPASVTVPMGTDRVALQLTAGGASATPATFTATYSGVEKTASVIVYDDAVVRGVAAIEPAVASLGVGRSMDLTVVLDYPAPAAGQVVQLSADAGLIVPATVTVAAGTLSATFELTAGDTPGTGLTVTASIGASLAEAVIEVTDAPAVGLVIAEVLYDTAGDDNTNEWVKLYNGSASSVDLSGYSLKYAGDNYSYGSLALSGTIAAGDCWLVGGPTSSAANFEPVLNQAVDFNPDIQNSGDAADAVALFNGDTIVDAVLYGGSNSANLQDENGVGNVDVGDAPANQSIRRLVDGTWEIAATPTPNVCPPF